VAVSAHRARDRHSLDGLAIGLAQVAITAVITAIALQAFLAAQPGPRLGPAIGARIGNRWGGRAEQVAGIDRILLGAYLMAERPGR
jgi:putative Mn2+ efflux pump MntP